MLPSGLGVASHFDEIAPKIAAAGYRVIAVNRRGFAGSKGPLEGLTIHDYASDVAGLIKKLASGQAHVLGMAYGNRVARCVASDYPKLVRTVILLAAGGKIPGDSEAYQALSRVFDPNLSNQERLKLLQVSVFSPQSDASPGLALRNSWPEAREAAQAANRATPVSDWWTGGTAPMLVIQGLDDRLAPPGNARSLKEEFGDRVRLVELERAGHALIFERPQAIQEAIIDFLNEHPISKR
jgi:pimeloyl-ACP methyl ester carboxylesterase